MNTSPTSPNLKQDILRRIDEEQICPRSRLFFTSRECFVWTLWLASVLVGALAVAVLLYVAVYMQYALYEATHSNWITFTVTVLPYLWLSVFAAMTYLAVKEFRSTKRGYRFKTLQVLGSSFVISLLGGIALHGAGFGYALDHALGTQMGMYMSLEKSEHQRWQQPEKGRLVGQVQPAPALLAPSDVIRFVDSDGTAWTLVTVELETSDLNVLVPERRLRLLGLVTAPEEFHVCGVFPWVYETALDRDVLRAQRQAFEEQMQRFKTNQATRRDAFDSSAVEVVEVGARPCATIAAVHNL